MCQEISVFQGKLKAGMRRREVQYRGGGGVFRERVYGGKRGGEGRDGGERGGD